MGTTAGHPAALLGTTTASLRARLAMGCFVLGTFVCTGLADVSAQRTNRLDMLASPCHRCGGELADRCAIKIQRNAPRHHLDVLFLQAGCRAVIAGDGALVAGLNARSVLLMSHGDAPGQSARGISAREPGNPGSRKAPSRKTPRSGQSYRCGCAGTESLRDAFSARHRAGQSLWFGP